MSIGGVNFSSKTINMKKHPSIQVIIGKVLTRTLALSLIIRTSVAFSRSIIVGNVRAMTFSSPRLSNAIPQSMVDVNNGNDIDIEIENLSLTPQLASMTKAFSTIPDEKMRYKQLLYMANQMESMDPSLMVSKNKVPGCLSTVYVDCIVMQTEGDDGSDDEIILNYVGDSDGLMTKGLVALLVRGLSGCTSEQIQKINPEFIRTAKISQSLTPGRNNGFLNMLKVMKEKAAAATKATLGDVDGGTVSDKKSFDTISSFEIKEDKPIYNEIMDKLINVLKPSTIELVDVSRESDESHFSLTIVVDAFSDLPPEKRDQIIHLVLGDTLENIQAIDIKAFSRDKI